MNSNSVLLFTRNGLGDAPEALQQLLAKRFPSLLVDSGALPAKILIYTDRVKLACERSPVLEQLRALQLRGVELILCSTCLDYVDMTNSVIAGIVGGMPDIIEAMQKARKMISL